MKPADTQRAAVEQRTPDKLTLPESAPQFAGERPQVDLVGIGRRATNYLTKMASREESFIPFFGGKVPWHGIPYVIHCPWDYGDGIGRLLESLVFVRRMTQSGEDLDLQNGMLKRLCSLYGPDGITYREANLWSTRVSGPYEMRSSLLALVAALEDGTESLEPLVASAVDAIDRVFSAELLPEASGVWDGQRWTGDVGIGVEVGAGLAVIDALMRAYNVTGNKTALTAAERIIDYYFFSSAALFRSDGTFCFPGDGGLVSRPSREAADYTPSLGHFHTRTCAAVGLARYGVARHDERCLTLARRLHDHMAGIGTSFGWFPENLFTCGHEVSELCATLDMIELELLLAGTGQTELYYPPERFVRNQVAVSQFAPDALVRQRIADTPSDLLELTGQISYAGVLRKLAGGFACVSYPDDVYTAYPGSRYDADGSYLIDISGCCSGSGAKSAYVVWRDTVMEDEHTVRVNFLFNRRHPALDVSYEEDETRGRLTLRVHTGKDVLFHLPEGVRAEQLIVSLDGTPVPFTVRDAYAQLSEDNPAKKDITVEFPLVVREERCEAGGLAYRVLWRGSKVCSVDCEDERSPRRNPYTTWFLPQPGGQ